MTLAEFEKAWKALKSGETMVYYVAPKGETLSTVRERREKVAAVAHRQRAREAVRPGRANPCRYAGRRHARQGRPGRLCGAEKIVKAGQESLRVKLRDDE